MNIHRRFFKQDTNPRDIGIDVQLWRGAYSSVKNCEMGLTLNVDGLNIQIFSLFNCSI